MFLAFGSKEEFKGKRLEGQKNISIDTIAEATKHSDVVVIAAVPQAIQSIVEAMGDVSKKVIIDTMNSVRVKPRSLFKYNRSVNEVDRL